MMIESTRPPGLATLAVHWAAIALLSTVLLALWPFRLASAAIAELLIRLSDATSDALRERLSR